MLFLEELNTFTNSKFDYLRVADCLIKAKSATVELTFLIPGELYATVSEENFAEIKSAVEKIIPRNLTPSIVYKKSYVDDDIASKYVYDYLVAECPTIGVNNIELSVNTTAELVNIVIEVKTAYYKYMMSNNFSENLQEYLSRKYCRRSVAKLIEKVETIEYESGLPLLSGHEIYVMRRVLTSDHEQLIGKQITTPPSYIADRAEVENSGVYCGKVVDIVKRVAKSGNPYFTITIDDTTGRMIAKAFTKSPSTSEYDLLKIDELIICQGKITLDMYAKDSVMMINSIAKCKIDFTSIVIKENYKIENDYYLLIKPEKYIDTKQIDMFNMSTADVAPKCLIGKNIVVFDLETTGIDKNAKIIEIGAVKLKDGKIVETFSTLINPNIELPSKIIEITHITDDMLYGKPEIQDVLPDFYKFTRGAIMVAHNSEFDMGYMTREGRDNKYNFDNRVLCTLNMARERVTSPNYKLGTLCEKFAISLENAHRAVHDAEATAKLFLELVKIKEII